MPDGERLVGDPGVADLRPQDMIATEDDFGLDDSLRVKKLVLLLTPSKASLTDDERRKFSTMGMTVWEYNYDLCHDSLSYPKINTNVIVIPLTMQGMLFYKNAHKYIKREEETRVILMLKRGEPSVNYLQRKNVFHVRNIIKDIPEPADDTLSWMNTLMTDVMPHVPGLASSLARILAGACSK
jgi:hypothetical protein